MRDRHELQKRLFRVEFAVEFALGNVQYVVVETEAVLVHEVVRALVPEEVLFLRDDVLFGSNGDHLEDKLRLDSNHRFKIKDCFIQCKSCLASAVQ